MKFQSDRMFNFYRIFNFDIVDLNLYRRKSIKSMITQIIKYIS